MILLQATQRDTLPYDLFDEVKYISKGSQVKPYSGDEAMLLLWGGADIGTALYNEQPNRFVNYKVPSIRDQHEMAMIQEAVRNDIPILGICRGAQLLCAAAGGTLMQHIEHHGDSHEITLHDESQRVIKCNSSHHQMMMPAGGATILASADSTLGYNQYSTPIQINRVPEVVYFPEMRGIGCQYHPEWSNCPQEAIDYLLRKIKEHLL